MTTETVDNRSARDKAMSAIDSMPVAPSALIEYQSRGRVIVIGGPEALEFAPRLRDKLHAEVLLTGGSVEPGATAIPAGSRNIEIEGHLGEFTITLGEQGRPNYEVLKTDLILDLELEPLMKMPIKPPGYFLADSANEFSLLNAINHLNEMIGTFEKPRYFDYDASICAHGRSGQTGCTRCLDTCPTQAITSLVESIEVDPYLCQGGGICAAVCPTGAIRFAYPGTADMLDHLRLLLKHYRDAGGENAVICFVSKRDYEQVGLWPDTWLPIVVEELPSIGMDVWLSALAYGASAVVLVETRSVSEAVDLALKEQLDFAQAILDGMHYDKNAIQHTTIDDMASIYVPAMPGITTANYTGLDEKRRTLFFAIDHLASQATDLANEIALPENAPFGRIHVDSQTCTLCMGCTSVCPAKAIQAGDESPRLLFIEANCVQCGLCQSACPEQSIQLQPRLLTDPEQRRVLTVLNEQAPFHCISCGKPFATQSIINNIMSKLSEHSMFQSERAKQRLMMCEDCRVIDVVQDTEAMQIGLEDMGHDDSFRRQ